jgi:hypothetical protein
MGGEVARQNWNISVMTSVGKRDSKVCWFRVRVGFVSLLVELEKGPFSR